MRYRSRHVRCSLAFSFYGTLRFNWSSKDPTADIRCASSATTSAPIPFGGTCRYYHVYVHHDIVLLPPKKLTEDSTSNRVVVVTKKTNTFKATVDVVRPSKHRGFLQVLWLQEEAVIQTIHATK